MNKSRIVQSALFAMLAFGVVNTAFAGPIYSFATFNAPGASGFGTSAFGINDLGQIVGLLWDAGNKTHGFVNTGGSFTTIDVPGASSTAAYGINDSGQVVGWFRNELGDHGFVNTDGSFTIINAPGANNTYIYGINDSGHIVGSFVDAQGSHGFVNTGGSFTIINVPDANNTYIYGINDSGHIVGSFVDAQGSHGFLNTGGSFTTLPGVATGINNTGQIVGSLGLYSDGSFSSIAVPAFCCTSARGINDKGQVVGWVGPPAAPEMAFVATPIPEPPSLLSLSTCLIALFGIARHRNRADRHSSARAIQKAV
jgi:probable HAF family extracellular repeat protein